MLTTCLSTVVAQGLEGLPDCAKDCATGSIPKQCQAIDIACICADKSFINNISCCVANKCSKDQQDAVIKFANQICGGAGVNDLPKSASCASGSSIATETPPRSSTSNKSSVTSTGTDTNASVTTTSGSSGSSSSPTSSQSDNNTKASSTSAPSPTTSTGRAALVQGKDTSLLAAIGAAVFALFV